jgi:hypothetical protein
VPDYEQVAWEIYLAFNFVFMQKNACLINWFLLVFYFLLKNSSDLSFLILLLLYGRSMLKKIVSSTSTDDLQFMVSMISKHPFFQAFSRSEIASLISVRILISF